MTDLPIIHRFPRPDRPLTDKETRLYALADEALVALENVFLKAEKFYQTPFPRPELNFKQRGKIAGSARPNSWEIRLNPILFLENSEAFLSEVIPHEAAHLITARRYGRVKPHGKEWQFVMNNVMGLPARVTHQFETTSVAGKTYPYRCQCQTHALTIIRHNRILRGWEYRCIKCKSLLIYLDKEIK